MLTGVGEVFLHFLQLFSMIASLQLFRVRHTLVSLQQLLVLVVAPAELTAHLLSLVHSVPVTIELVRLVKHCTTLNALEPAALGVNLPLVTTQSMLGLECFTTNFTDEGSI